MYKIKMKNQILKKVGRSRDANQSLPTAQKQENTLFKLFVANSNMSFF